MASALHNLSSYNPDTVPDGKGYKIGIVVSEWNEEVTGALLQGAYDTLVKHGVDSEDILVRTVPGSFELVYGTSLMLKTRDLDAIIAIGCVIRGDTPHFDYICQGTTQGLTTLNAQGQIPIINGLLTVNTMEQAEARTGGSVGDKGKEFALTAIKMIDYAWQFQK